MSFDHMILQYSGNKNIIAVIRTRPNIYIYILLQYATMIHCVINIALRHSSQHDRIRAVSGISTISRSSVIFQRHC